MKIGILSSQKSSYSTKRLKEAASRDGHTVLIIDFLKCRLMVETNRLSLFYGSRKVQDLDIALSRVGSSFTEYGLAIIYQLELMGIPVVNSSQALLISRNKLRALQLLARHGFQIAKTVMATSRTASEMRGAIRETIRFAGGGPLVLKPVTGSQGIGVLLAESQQKAESLFEALWDSGKDFLMQQFIEEAGGKDIRALVIGGEVVAAMRREAREGDFRANIHRGGTGVSLTLNEEYREVAVNAANLMGLEIAGVDLIETSAGPLILEVNASPGFEGLENATGENIAEKMIRYLCQYGEAMRR
ncbi:MAG: RimK family alpha-L-glutamate ligase [Candidatus Tectomicrobia bacterium]|nr:RimK family alpha-L-glutamate ligase [Candidatus Tectomicrobia bacterium]